MAGNKECRGKCLDVNGNPLPPKTLDYSTLNNLKFWASVTGAPRSFEVHLKSIQLPSVFINPTELGFDNALSVHNHGDTVQYSDLVLEFLVDASLENYLFFKRLMEKDAVDNSDPYGVIVNPTTANDKLVPWYFTFKCPTITNLSGIKFSFSEGKDEITASVTITVIKWDVNNLPLKEEA